MEPHSRTLAVKGYHSIIRESEKPTGEVDKHEFKAETRMLLDIVAKSLYSENEVFIRELVSNSSDAIEKFRFLANTSEHDKIVEVDRKLEIHIETNKQDRKLTIQDKGIGMTREELIDNLGTIARSGSKNFLKQLEESGKSAADSNIIGQFGVGFYSVIIKDSISLKVLVNDTSLLSGIHVCHPCRSIHKGFQP